MSTDTVPQSPPISRSSSQSKRSTPQLSLDLSDLPPLIEPSPPSNCLLVTNLQDPAIFAPTTLAQIRQLIESHSPDGVHTFSPLRGLRRIVITFLTVDAAIAIRSVLDGETLFGYRVRVYFGSMCPIEIPDQHLQAPKADKQFLISPPVSPPHGWESKEEDPPNKEVHANDLANALERLNASKAEAGESSPTRMIASQKNSRSPNRGRSGSVVVYNPEDHGHSPQLPAIAVEDLTDNESETSPTELVDEPVRKIIAHTSRPPVELMTDA